MRTSLRLALLGGLAMGLGAAGTASAQTTTTPSTTTPSTTTSPSMTTPSTTAPSVGAPGTASRDSSSATDRSDNPGNRTSLVDASALEAGANSFTEGQARSRLEDAGFTAIEGLAKDDQGFWRGRAMHNGQMTEVAMDFRGRIAAGPNLASLGAGTRQDSGTSATRPDGTPGNPPGTAASRATDRATGSNLSGTNPSANRPDGTPGNPPSTAVGRTVDRMQGQTPQPDGTTANPPGTAAGRAVDRATGSNLSGANPPPPANR